MKKTRIYISGPYTAETPRLTQFNVNKAISIGCELVRLGYIPFIPHLGHYISLHPEGNFDYQFWVEYGINWLKACDAFFYIESSPGADIELSEAEKMEIPIYRSIEKVPRIAKQGKDCS